MNGTLEVISTVGQGTVFTVTLPLAVGNDRGVAERLAAVETPPDLPVPTGPPADGMSVLYIEDNPVNFRLVERCLQSRPDVRMIGATCGIEGLALARTEHPDLILLDLHLPDVSGEDVATALRADDATREIPIVVLSADAYSSKRRHLLALGVDGYLTKPFKVPELIALIKELVGRSAQGAPER